MNDLNIGQGYSTTAICVAGIYCITFLVTMLVIVFGGDPSLHDAWVYSLMPIRELPMP